MKRMLMILFLTPAAFAPAFAQTGGGFDLSHRVVAGGGSNSTGGLFKIEGTAGQAAAGTFVGGGNFAVRGGFWSFDALAPTAAQVTISGTIRTMGGAGIRNVRLTLTDAGGAVRTAQTGTFGHFRFEAVTAGQTYLLEASARRFFFADPVRLLSVRDEISNADFVAVTPVNLDAAGKEPD